MEHLSRQIEALERRIRHLTVGATLLGLSLVAVVAIAAVQDNKVQDNKVVDQITVRKLVVVDEKGKQRAVLDHRPQVGPMLRLFDKKENLRSSFSESRWALFDLGGKPVHAVPN